MNNLQQKYLDRFSTILIYFIIFQPVLDIITSISIFYFETTITLGIVVRLLFMLLAITFIFLYKKNRLGKIALILLCSFIMVIGIGFIAGFFVKPIFSVFAEVQFYAKSFYFIVMFISYTLALTLLREYFADRLTEIVIKPIVIAMTIIGVVFVLAIITGTGFETYRYMKAGTKAWFHAGNEIGAALSIGLPVVILFAIQKTKKITHVLYWLPALLVIFSLIMIGTKVGYLAVMFTLVVAFLSLVVFLFSKKQHMKPSLAIVTLILVATTLVSPYTPVFLNTGLHFSYIDEKKQDDDDEEVIEEEIVIPEDSKLGHFIDENRIVSVLLSGRQYFWIETHQMFLEAPLVQKLFGMGYAGNYPKKAKLIEMDLHDIFYSYGMIGFLLFISPFLYAISRIVKNREKYREKILNIEFVMLLCSIVLGLGIAFIAGHVLIAPAVSIYLAVILAYLFVNFYIVKTGN